MTIKAFQKLVCDFYRKNKRDLPWRNTTNPYHIVVSEIMLQQTQVSRVLKKYPEFLKVFSTWKSLAAASNKDALSVWSGMGYNRRALYLKKIAAIVYRQYHNKLPKDPTILETFPGIGKGTAGSILAFAYNLPTVFIETNIRRVFIHSFFSDKKDISDKEIFPLIEETLDKANPREWYYALMDYGTYLAKQVDNPNKKSKHYAIQSKFEGSSRQIRGQVLRLLLKNPLKQEHLFKNIPSDKNKIRQVIDDLEKEGFIKEKNGFFNVK